MSWTFGIKMTNLKGNKMESNLNRTPTDPKLDEATMGDHQVCLRWNNFHSSVAATLEYMWDEESLVDVTLFCEGQEIRAHKVNIRLPLHSLQKF